MVLGIGIDFGIQIVNRFKLEIEGYLEKGELQRKLVETITKVVKPITTTTLAALIRFRAQFGKINCHERLREYDEFGCIDVYAHF